MRNIKNKEITLPHIGARTIKTGIAVFICSIISTLILKRDSASIACVASIICIQNDIETSVNNGKNRLIGTIVGAIIGFLVMFIWHKTNSNPFIASLVAGLGTIATIYICVLLKINQCILTACVMFLIIVMNVSEDQWLTYSIMRTIDTFIGVIVGINVNSLLFKESFKKVKSKNTKK